MHRLRIIPLLIAFFVVGTQAVCAQDPECTLTNADIAEMAEAKLSESTILLAIDLCEPNFDTSESAIGELKAAGITPKIIDAMLHPERVTLASGDYSPPNAVNEVVLIDDESRVLLNRAKTTTRLLSQGLLVRLSVKDFVIFEGDQASLRLTNPKPVFEISLRADVPNPGNPKLVRLDQKRGKRQINTGLFTIGTSRDGFRESETVPTIIEKTRIYSVPNGTRYILYRITPRDPLPPGEYAFFPRHHLGECFDFGVDKRAD